MRDPEIMFYLRREQDAFLFGHYGHEGRAVWETGPPDRFDIDVCDFTTVLNRLMAVGRRRQ